jgi:hypothetical protein
MFFQHDKARPHTNAAKSAAIGTALFEVSPKPSAACLQLSGKVSNEFISRVMIKLKPLRENDLEKSLKKPYTDRFETRVHF